MLEGFRMELITHYSNIKIIILKQNKCISLHAHVDIINISRMLCKAHLQK